MRISASEFILFCNPPLENVRRLSSIVPEVELMMDGDAWEHDQNGWAAQVKMLKGINVPMSAHPPAWDVNPAAPLLALREAASFLNKKALEFCVDMGIKQMVYHPGYYDRDSFFSLNRAKDHAYQLLDELIALAKPAGITLAFENIGGPAATLFTQEEFIHALDGIDPCAQLLLDVGHANMNGWNIPEVIDRTAAGSAPCTCMITTVPATHICRWDRAASTGQGPLHRCVSSRKAASTSWSTSPVQIWKSLQRAGICSLTLSAEKINIAGR